MQITNRGYVFLFHALIVGPLLFFIGYKGIKTPEALFTLLLIVGLVVILYHGYMFYKVGLLSN